MSLTTVTSRCAACRNQRRRCPPDGIFSPHFPSTDPERFDAVHRVYGASKVAKMLEEIPPEMRAQAAHALHFEAKCRIRDPIYGSVGIISMLNEEIHHTGTELAQLRARVAFLASDASEEPKELGWDTPSIAGLNKSIPCNKTSVNRVRKTALCSLQTFHSI